MERSATPARRVLGVSAYYHDSAAVLIDNGRIVAAAQEERFTRNKHDHRFPENAVRYCLDAAGCAASELDAVAYYDKPLLTFDRLLETYLDYVPAGFASFLRAMPLWLREKLWIRDRLAEELNFTGEILFSEHHESHAASAFYPSPFDRAAVLTVDGVGEWATAAWGVGKGSELNLLAQQRFPHSLGLLYSALTYYLGFKVNSGEYKVMGLAPYGRPEYVDRILEHVVDLRPDGSLRLNMELFSFAHGLRMTNRRFDEVFGAPRRMPETELTQFHMDIARSVQDVVELAMLRMARHVRKETGEKNLCMAGGVALNCVANGKILRENIFDEIWIQPAAGDAGGALGAALSVWHQFFENDRPAPAPGRDAMQASYLGPEFSDQEIADALDMAGARYERLSRSQMLAAAAEALADEQVVGWFQGRMEFGPRALGARSILGDPRSPKMQSVLNLKIKYRESFRPFAPSVLREDASKYFDLDAESPYMLLVAPVRDELLIPMTAEQDSLFGIEKLHVPRSTIPAVTHVDYSARVQTVEQQANGAYYDLIEAFRQRTGCGLVVNTSFNVRGEPIVCTPEDAYRCFMRTEMDVLAIGNILVRKDAQAALVEEESWQEEFQLD